MTTDAERLIAAVNEAMEPPTTYRDPSPNPTIGTTPPVPQPGRPPMSQKATDASMLMLAAGAASLPIGGATSLVLYTLGHVDPVALAIGAAGPVALVLAVGSLVRSAGRGLQGIKVEHNHYSGAVHQERRTAITETRGLFAKTINKQ
ncbi:hypothetical protein OHA37_26965 [Streptomyces sp. NBC_00335]|uniref:hypothetical protein n=1 Tax=unclassified Streptomyces TaxID=2593676 RepID=UPI0022582310|nr:MULTISPECIES: hypothetical protein [unclassified Streptomyces]MCX5407492.1 hypothetical protein [Streptomyces sp. NBC_00086]